MHSQAIGGSHQETDLHVPGLQMVGGNRGGTRTDVCK